MAKQQANEALFFALGFESKGYHRWSSLKESSRKEKFVSLYGTSAAILAEIWSLLNVEKSCRPLYLLVLYRWFKSYLTEQELSVDFDLSINTIKKWNWILVCEIAGLRALKIDVNWNDDAGFLLVMTVDGIHYPFQEPRPFSTSMSSHKFGGKAGVLYEYVLSAHKQQLMWLNGPFPAATNDKTCLRNHGLQKAIQKKQQQRKEKRIRVIADSGYFAVDLLSVLSFRNEFDPRTIAYYKDRALSRHESFNRLTKNYKILKEPFRHDRGWNPEYKFPYHKAVTEAICVTIQMELDNGSKALFDPYPD